MVGEIILHYRILDELHGGGMGMVYVAEDTKLKRTVALKFLAENLSSDRRAVALFRNEARMASVLSHPNICAVYGEEEVDTRYFIVMEYVEGKTLKQCISGKPLDVNTVLALAIQIADALDCAHMRGILHCDVKPSNIKVTPQGQAKLLDFGIAKKASSGMPVQPAAQKKDWEASREEEEALIGTVGYMSPEQTLGGKLDARTDLFSFGAVLYEMCTGTPAFKGVTKAAMSDAVLHKSPVSPSRLIPELPSRLEGIIARALQRDRETRYQSAADLRSDLRRLQREIDSESPTAWGVPPPRPRTFPWRTGLEIAGLSMLVLVLGLGWYFWKHVGPAPELQTFQLTANSRDLPVTAAAISPDGKEVAFADGSGLYIEVVSSREIHALPTPDNSAIYSIAWYPNQDKLLVSSIERIEQRSSLWTISILDRKILMLRDRAAEGAVSPDESKVAFVSESGNEIWTIGIGGEEPRRMVSATTGNGFRNPSWFADGSRLLYETESRGSNGACRLESRSLERDDVTEILSNPELSAHLLSPDGSLIYALSSLPPTESKATLYKIRLDNKTRSATDTPHQIASLPGFRVNAISGTSNGQRLAVLKAIAQADVYVGTLAKRGTAIEDDRRLTLNDRDDFPIAWSTDSKSLFFGSDRNGRWEVYQQSLDEQSPIRIVSDMEGIHSAQLSPDGSSILYVSSLPSHSSTPGGPNNLMRIPLSNSAPQVTLLAKNFAGTLSCARFPSTLCLVAEFDANETKFYALEQSKEKGKEIARLKLDRVRQFNWSLSPDGSRIAVANQVENGESILFVDLSSGVRKEVIIEGSFAFQTLNWGPDEKELIVSNRSHRGFDLIHIDLDGHTHVLRHEDGNLSLEGIPSPDGKRIAFTEWTSNNNVWLIDKFQ
jgi:serine/threonine protein kinase